MAARKNLSHPEKVRERIRTTQLVRRLRNHALGKLEMSPTQVKAVEILLRKTLPDLSSVEMTADVRQRDVSDQPLTDEQWSKQYSATH